MRKYSLGCFIREGALLFLDSIKFLSRSGGFSVWKRIKFFFHLATDSLKDFQKALSDSLPALGGAEKKSFSSPYLVSILVPVYKPNPIFLKKALLSALNQKVARKEVLVGFDGEQPKAVYKVVEELKEKYKDELNYFHIDRSESGGGISATTNYLADRANGDALLLMDHDDLISLDLLAYYLEALEKEEKPLSKVLYCNEYKINEKDQPLPLSFLEKPEVPPFPYVFNNYICHCLLVPKILWKEVGGLRTKFNGAQDYDLVLRLDLAGAQFKNIPEYLYAWRVHSGSTAGNSGQKNYAHEAGQNALQEYLEKKGLDLPVEEGLRSLTYRVRPKDIDPSYIEIVNNGNFLEKMKTSSDKKISAYLFLNPKVVLEKSALQELSRWLSLPDIGAVGARITYPNGFFLRGPIYEGQDASNALRKDGLRVWESTIGVPDRFSSDCILVRKEALFSLEDLDLKGEPWEQTLASRIKEKGWTLLYTPFAEGAYFEKA